MKKVGRILLCTIPLIVYIVLQFGGSFAGSIVAGVMAGVEAGVTGNAGNMALMMQRMQEIYADMIPVLIFGIHIIAIIVGAIWVYILFGKKKPGNPVKSFSWITIAVVVLCAVGLQYVCSSALSLVQALNPALLENYMQLMESAGFMELNLFSIVASVCLAPIGEEILFRGVTLRLAKNAVKNFWIANSIQAVCFGIAHMNMVQGIYAFFMGLVFGYIYEKYGSLYVPILLHALINFLGTVVSGVSESKMPENAAEPGIGSCFMMLVVFAAVLTAGLVLMKKDKKIEEPVQIEGEDEYATV